MPEEFLSPIPKIVEPYTDTPSRPTVPRHRLGRVPRTLIAVTLLVVVFVCIGYRQYTTVVAPHTVKNSSSAPPTETVSINLENPKNTVAYLRDADLGEGVSTQVWLIDPTSGDEEQLPLSEVSQVYKRYGSTELFYRPHGNTGEYRVINVETGEIESMTLVSHPDVAATEMVQIWNSDHISPDGKWIFFQVDFMVPCPSPLPSSFEGGSGPCMADESLETPSGYYLYDRVTKKATSLGASDLRVSRWDAANQKLYYVDRNVTKSLDLVTKLSSTIDSSTHFGYFGYPFLQSKSFTRYEGATGDDGGVPFGKIALVSLEDNSSTTIDTADDWAVIQPFVTLSPDEKNVLFIRGNTIEGIHRDGIYRYNIESKKLTRFTPEDSLLSFRLYGDWLDDSTFITVAHTLEDNLTNGNDYLVKIDLSAGTVTRLTDHARVYSYNEN